MFHNYKDYLSYYKLYEKELIELKKKGIINKIGVSLHNNQDIYDVLNNQYIDLIQIPYNLLDNKLKRQKVLTTAKKII